MRLVVDRGGHGNGTSDECGIGHFIRCSAVPRPRTVKNPSVLAPSVQRHVHIPAAGCVGRPDRPQRIVALQEPSGNVPRVGTPLRLGNGIARGVKGIPAPVVSCRSVRIPNAQNRNEARPVFDGIDRLQQWGVGNGCVPNRIHERIKAADPRMGFFVRCAIR